MPPRPVPGEHVKRYGLPCTESPIQEVTFNAIFKPAKLVCTLKASSPANQQRLFWHQMVVTRFLLSTCSVSYPITSSHPRRNGKSFVLLKHLGNCSYVRRNSSDFKVQRLEGMNMHFLSQSHPQIHHTFCPW